MKVLTRVLIACFWLLLPFTAFADREETVKYHMINDLDYIKRTFEIQYAPTEWKHQHLGWSLDTEYERAKKKILETEHISTKQFQKILAGFFHAMQDLHVKVLFHSTEYAELPFSVIKADGRYFVSYVYKEQLSPDIYEINEGDELLEFDGKPIKEVIEELKKEMVGSGRTATDFALAANFLTYRPGGAGIMVPKGNTKIKVRGQNGEKSYQLTWSYAPEYVSNHYAQAEETKKTTKFSAYEDVRKHMPSKDLSSPVLNHLFALKQKAKNYKNFNLHEINSPISYIPILGKVHWMSDINTDSFFSYLFETEDNKLVGYIRIPHYMGNEENFEEQVEKFGELVDLFQDNADALIIDEVNNGGGAAYYMYALLSMLTDKPLSTPKHHHKINQADVVDALYMIDLVNLVNSDEDAKMAFGETYVGFPVSYQFAQFWKDFANFVIEEWKAERYLTTPYHLQGADQIMPHPKYRFTKPLMVIVNELSISCADFFPAILQDNKRALIVGTKTAGAGGSIERNSFPNRHGIELFTCTSTKAIRKDNKPIENLGVTPNVEIKLTAKDMQEGMEPYKAKVLNAVKKILKSSP